MTAISFIVMVTYLARYHGTIFEEFTKNKGQLENISRFAKVKGSLGFVFGSQLTKLSTQNDIKSVDNTKTKNKKEVTEYWIKIFFISFI